MTALRPYNIGMELLRMNGLQISYLTKRLAVMPHGSFGVHRGEAVVNVTYDPCDKTVDYNHKKVYRIDSAQGRHINRAGRYRLSLRSR